MYTIIDCEGKEVMIINETLLLFIDKCQSMSRSYDNLRYTHAEQLKKELSKELDNIMENVNY